MLSISKNDRFNSGFIPLQSLLYKYSIHYTYTKNYVVICQWFLELRPPPPPARRKVPSNVLLSHFSKKKVRQGGTPIVKCSVPTPYKKWENPRLTWYI